MERPTLDIFLTYRTPDHHHLRRPRVAAELEAQWRRTLRIDPAYSGEHEESDGYVSDDPEDSNYCRPLFRELMMVASNDQTLVA